MFPPIIYYSLYLIGAFFVLVKSADFLISSSSVLGRKIGISEFVIGLTIVAIGTSLPELFTSIMAILTSESYSGFVVGTVLGSNIANVLLIFPFLLIFAKSFSVRVRGFNLIFLWLSSILLGFFVFLERFSLWVGVVFLIMFVFYIFYNFRMGKKGEIVEKTKIIEQESGMNRRSYFFLIVVLVLSLVGINFGARGVVFGIEKIGEILFIPIELLTLSVVAFATSLPELVVSYLSAKRGEIDIGVGNIVGSNISNVFFIVGFSSVLKSLDISLATYLVGIIFMFLATLIFHYIVSKEGAKKWYGIVMLLIYGVYVWMIF